MENFKYTMAYLYFCLSMCLCSLYVSAVSFVVYIWFFFFCQYVCLNVFWGIYRIFACLCIYSFLYVLWRMMMMMPCTFLQNGTCCWWNKAQLTIRITENKWAKYVLIDTVHVFIRRRHAAYSFLCYFTLHGYPTLQPQCCHVLVRVTSLHCILRKTSHHVDCI